jgi:hypothetical protein
MEQIVTTLEEDIGQLCEEGLQMALDNLLLLLVNKIEDDLTSLVGVRPLTHLDGVLDMVLAKLKQVPLALGVIKFDRVRDLRVEELVWVLLGFKQLLVMVVQGIRQLSVLTLTAELVAESEQLLRHLVVKVEQLGVLA